MRFTKATSALVAAIYIFLWVLALNGATNLIAVLTVPLVLAVLVAFGVWLNRFMGITPRHQHFESPPDDATSEPVASDAPPRATAEEQGDDGAPPPAP